MNNFDFLQDLFKKYNIYGEFFNFINANGADMPDAPKMGNGELGVVVDGSETTQTYYLNTNSFWASVNAEGEVSYSSGKGKLSIGGLTITSEKPIIETGESTNLAKSKTVTACCSQYTTPAKATDGDTTTNTDGADKLDNTRARIQDSELYSCRFSDLPPAEEDVVTPSFYAKQDILNAEVTVNQTIGNGTYETTSFVTEDGLLITELTLTGKKAQTLYVKLWNHGSVHSLAAQAGVNDDKTMYIARGTQGNQVESRAGIVTKITGASILDVQKQSDSAVWTAIEVQPDTTVTLTTAVSSDRGMHNAIPDLNSFISNAAALLSGMDTVENERAAHRDLWKDYWLASYVNLNDVVLMKYYYGALYELNCIINNGEVAPALFGNFNTVDDPRWYGLYFQNYNFMSTFWGILSSNRTELYQPLYEQIFATSYGAQRRAAAAGYKGLNYSRITSPVGANTTGWIAPATQNVASIKKRNSLDVQLSLGAFMANDAAKYYYYTMDADYLPRVYKLVKQNLDFYLDYLEKENLSNGDYRYIVRDSKARETSPGTLNSTLDLTYCRLMLLYALDMSARLKVDQNQYDIWKDYLEHLSDLPTTTFNGKTVLTEEESYPDGVMALKGLTADTGGVGDNVDNMNSIFPGTVINLESEQQWIEIAQNTLEEMQSWAQGNSFVKVFTVAARCGYNADKLVQVLKERIDVQLRNDLMIYDGAHGVEKAGTIEAINSMMLQSAEGIIHIFPVWPASMDCSFTRLRTNGAFLFSAEYDSTAGAVKDGVTMYSEAGATATIASLWTESMTVLDENGNRVKTTKGTAPNHEEEITYTFATQAGKTYTFVKDNTEAPNEAAVAR